MSSSGSSLFNLVIVDNLLQEVFEDLVSWRGPGVSAQARDPWTLACRFGSENRTLGNCCRLSLKRCRLWNSAARGWAGFCWHLAALTLDSFWSWKRRVLSANLWRADLFFYFFGFVRLMLSIFFCVDAVWSPFPYNKITDFHFDFSFYFVFENFLLEFECAACLLFRLLIGLL